MHRRQKTRQRRTHLQKTRRLRTRLRKVAEAAADLKVDPAAAEDPREDQDPAAELKAAPAEEKADPAPKCFCIGRGAQVLLQRQPKCF